MTDMNVENTPQLRTGITIDAPPSRVWAVLTEFGAYADWTSMVQGREIPAELAPGARATFCAVPGTGWERTFNVEILRVEPHAVLEWQGGEPGYFLGVHRFELQADGDDRTLFTNSEFFSGSMAETLMEKHGDDARREFEQFNEDLKKRAESAAS